MYYVNSYFASLVKSGEELCGDHVESIRLPDSTIFVLSDGLGSGVKANILATMTSKIATTMLKEGSTIYETVDTIANTLPVCNIRKLAYSTFTIIKINHNGGCYVVEFDNPNYFLFEGKKFIETKRNKLVINDKVLYESSFTMTENSLFVIASDGVIHAGVGKLLDLGWRWNNVQKFIRSTFNQNHNPKIIVDEIIKVCKILYSNTPGDDTTVLSIQLKKQKDISMFVGPPENKENDEIYVNSFLRNPAFKIVCGGTTANIFSRIIGEPLDVDLKTMTKFIPPIANLKGVDLVTEGVITLREVVSILEKYIHNSNDCYDQLNQNNGASIIAKILIEDCKKINITFGQAVNTTHQQKDYEDISFNIKKRQIIQISELLKTLNKDVTLCFV